MVKVVYEDTVDWEPLHIRFLFDVVPLPERCQGLAEFAIKWIRAQEAASPEKWQFCETSTQISSSGTVEVFCELMPQDEVENLAQAVGKECPFVTEMRLGEPETGPATLGKIRWVKVPCRSVVIDGIAHEVDAFSISQTKVSAGQFTEFLDQTGHIPYRDQAEDHPGITMTDQKMTWGKSPKTPMFGLAYDDAIAFCQWAGYRLPTDPELRIFHEFAFVE